MDPVHVERFFLGCVAHASYLVGSGGVAAVIDPQRDIDVYLNVAAKLGFTIEHVIETHLHTDFVSGRQELADRTGARIYLGDAADRTFPHVAMRDGDCIRFGNCRLQFLATPGHTLESVCIVMTDLARPERPRAVFTGDTLLAGDVGRPLVSLRHTPQQLAAMLYQSLHEKILTLSDEVEILPAHGAGPLCGRQVSTERSSTIGREKRSNYVPQTQSCDEFIRLLTDGLPVRPEHLTRGVEPSREGAAPLDELPHPAALTASEVLRQQAAGAVVLDTRPIMQFAVGHVPGSIHIGLTGQFASWARRLLGLGARIIIAEEDPDQVRESQIRLARVGIEDVGGYLAEGVIGWIRGGYPLDYIPQLAGWEVLELTKKEHESVAILDVRERAELGASSIANSIRIPLSELQARVHEINRGKLVIIYCKSGYRSSIASSLIRRSGIRDVANLTGGLDAWMAAELPCAAASAAH